MKRSILAVVISLCMLLAMFAGCAQSSPESASANEQQSAASAQAAPADTLKPAESSQAADNAAVPGVDRPFQVAMVAINLTSPSFVDYMNGCNEAAAVLGIDMIWKSAEGSLDKQIDIMRSLVQQKVDMIIVDSIDVEGIKPIINECEAAGVKVLATGSPVDGDTNYSVTYPDKRDSAFAAKVLGNLYKDKYENGTIALILGTPGNLVNNNRQQGFQEVMSSEFPQFKIVEGIGNWDPGEAMKKTEDILRANPDVIHIHVIQDGMSFGAYSAMVNVTSGGSPIPMSANDCEPEGLEHFKKGEYVIENLVGSVRIGYWNMIIADYILRGEPMDRIQYLPTYKVLPDDIKAWVIEKGINIDENGNEIAIISGDEVEAIANGYREEFSKNIFKPTLSK